MLLKDRFATDGAFLFRWRSFLPLVFLIPVLIALPQSGYMEASFGDDIEDLWGVFSVFLAFAGMAVRIATVGFVPAGTSGRNTATQRADRLNTTGLYSIVRNPLYLGNMITFLGFVLAVNVWWLPLIALPCVFFYYERIVFAEETFLLAKYGDAYETWGARTPAFLPDFRLWRRPDLPFSPRTVLGREYHGLFHIVVALTLIEGASSVVGEGQSVEQWLLGGVGWPAALLAASLFYAVVRTIRKKTTWLVVPGR